jgi:pilus assembly protein CpaB
MNRKHALMIFVGAWVSAGLLTWFLYASTKTPRIEKTIPIQAAAHDMPAGTLLRKADLKTVRMLERDVPKDAILDQAAALNRPLLFPVTANEAVTLSKISSATGIEGLAAIIEVGKRAVAVPITDSSGAGLIQPRAHVDVLFTKPGSASEAVTTTILEDAIVLAIGRTTEAVSSSTTAAANALAQAPRTTAQSATLLVTPEQARKLELAKNEGKISLALRNPLDRSVTSDRSATTSQALYPVNEFAHAKPVRVEPPKVVVTKAPPTPKNVVDVFRGDKHVREVFQ